MSNLKKKGKIVAVSHAYVRSINRKIFDLLCDRGWEVVVVAPRVWKSGKTIIELELDSLSRIKTKGLNTFGTSLRSYTYDGLDALLNQENPNLVFAEIDPISKTALELGKWCRKQNAKLVSLTCENLSYDFGAVWKRAGTKALLSTIAKRVMSIRSRKLVDHVFTTSKDGLQVFDSLHFSSVSTLPLGFDPKHFFPNQAKRNDIRSALTLRGIVFAYFGRLVPEKGVHLLLEALAKMLDCDWNLILNRFEVTDITYAKKIDSLLNHLQLRRRVVFAEAAHGKIADYMNAADVVVIPSTSTANWKEQYGRVAPEAMACGKTLVAFKSGALPELIGHHGLLVDEGDTEKLGEVLRMIADGRIDTESYGPSAAKYSLENLSIHRQVDQMEEIFSRLLTAQNR